MMKFALILVLFVMIHQQANGCFGGGGGDGGYDYGYGFVGGGLCYGSKFACMDNGCRREG